MRPLITFAAILCFCAPTFAQQQWGDIKGRIVWPASAIPAQRVLNVGPLPPGVGPIVDDGLLIDGESKGVKNVMVWLADPNGAPLPVHPKLAPIPNNVVKVEWSKLQFSPRITMMRAGQAVDLVNDRPVQENVRLSGNPDFNGTINENIAAGAVVRKVLKAERRPLQLANDNHDWMAGRIAVFDHPYFALTDSDGNFRIKDAPAGNYLIYLLHEKAGWQHTPRVARNGVGGSKGQPIQIPAGNILNLGQITFQQ